MSLSNARQRFSLKIGAAQGKFSSQSSTRPKAKCQSSYIPIGESKFPSPPSLDLLGLLVDSSPSRCETETLVFLPAVTQLFLSTSRSCLQVLSIVKANHKCDVLFMFLTSSDLPFCLQLEKTLCFKRAHVIIMGIISHNIQRFYLHSKRREFHKNQGHWEVNLKFCP